MTQIIETLYGHLVIGPAGSGKTTYCEAISKHLSDGLNREVILANLDPANDTLPYTCHIDIGELVQLTEVMKNENLGPNGSFLYCMDFLDQNSDWLFQRINEEFKKSKQRIETRDNSDGRRRPYIIFDCPGQIELYTNYPVFKNIIHKLLNGHKANNKNLEQNSTCSTLKFEMRLVTVNIVDSHYANDPAKFITVILNSLLSMLHIETPYINILSKVDLMEQYGETDFALDFYCELPDLRRLVDRISDDPYLAKYKKLTKSIASIIENYAVVSYVPLDINKQEMIAKVIALVDRANGFYMSDLSNNQDVFNYYKMIQADFQSSKYGNLM